MKRKILVVDDERRGAEQVAELLEESGFETRCVTSAREVFPAIWALSSELVTFDVDLGQHSGLALAESLLHNGLVSSFVFMTGQVGGKPPSLSGSTVLQKPFSIHTLLEAVRLEFSRKDNLWAGGDGDSGR